LADGSEKEKSFDDIMGTKAGAQIADKDGVVEQVRDKYITVRYKDGEVAKKYLYKEFPFNRKTALHNTPVVKKGQVVRRGDLLAKSNYTDDKGTLAMGLNAVTAVIPYKGFSMEDAIVVSENFAKKLTSEHMYTDSLEYKRGVKGGLAHYTGMFPNKYTIGQLEKLDKEGVVRKGMLLDKDDPVILATKPRVISSASQKLGKLSAHMKNAKNDASLIWEKDYIGAVTDVVRNRNGIKVTIKTAESAKPGDKIVFRSGQKGTISKIIPDAHMPRTDAGEKMEVLLNPLGIPSRVNNSIIYELLLGKIAKKRGIPYKLASFNKKGTKWFDFVESELSKHGINDTEYLFDPESNKKIKNPVTVGNGHILKLHHTATKGFSARNQGAYDVDEQPLKGGDEMAQSKRLSGLETHGLLSSGAYGILKDMSLVRGARNDDYWQQLRMGYDPHIPDTPMVFNKFRTLLQGTGYHAREMGKKGKLRLGPLTDKVLSEYNPVQIRNPGLIDARALSKGSVIPVAGGLFDDALVTSNKYGYIPLPFEVPNPAFEEPVRKILGLTQKQFRDIMSSREDLPDYLKDRIKNFATK
jgi:DNA-directed RNA polymerase beta subunit